MDEPFDYEQLDEFHQEVAEYQAASLVIQNTEGDELQQLVASLFALNRQTQETLLTLVMILERGVKVPANRLAQELRGIADTIPVVAASDESDDD